eukprot:Sspe_Gene.41472::Locus_20047_Transcript_1_1_Confidence_1.000_Length_2121::g.41472::m.41472
MIQWLLSQTWWLLGGIATVLLAVINTSKDKMIHSNKTRRSWGHILLRVPLLLIFGMMMLFELGLYIGVRIAVVLVETMLARRSRKLSALHKRRRNARTYKEHVAYCKEADIQEKRESWKGRAVSQHYDSNLLESAIAKLREARKLEDPKQFMRVCCLSRNYGGIMNYELYTKTWTGTKYLIEEYVEEVVKGLRWLSSLQVPVGSDVAVLREHFLLKAKMEFGNSALLMSGGAMMGIYHFGVIKALLYEGLLPKIISGTSAGSVVGCWLCTRNDEELKEQFDEPSELVRRLGEEGPFWGGRTFQMKQALHKGVIYDENNFLKRIEWFTRGFTFREAFEHTGRVLNITCTPLKTNVRGHPPLMLNYVTAPDVCIAHAVCASSCVPFLMRPIALMEKAKDEDGSYKVVDGKPVLCPFLNIDDRAAVQMRDGTFESDVPVLSMAHMFNSQFNIVSQVNPHIVPFFFNNIGLPGRPLRTWHTKGGWRGGFILSLLEMWLKEDMRKNLRILASARLLFDALGVDWSLVWLQDSYGDVTITPPINLRDYWNISSNLPPGEEGDRDFARKVRISERNTWKAIPMIRNRIEIQKALDDAILEHCHKKVEQEQEDLAPTFTPTPCQHHVPVTPPMASGPGKLPTSKDLNSPLLKEPSSGYSSPFTKDDMSAESPFVKDSSSPLEGTTSDSSTN